MEVISTDIWPEDDISVELTHSYDTIGTHYAYHQGIGSQPLGNKDYVSLVKSPQYNDIIVNFVHGMISGEYGTIEQLQAEFKNMFSSDYEPVLSDNYDWLSDYYTEIRNDLINHAKKLIADDKTLSDYAQYVWTISTKTINDLSCIDISNIAEIYIPPHITELPDGFLSNAVNLRQIHFGPDANAHQLSSIGASAFYNAYALECLNLPNNVERIGDYAFNNSTNMSAIIFGSSYIEYDETKVFQNINKDRCFFAKNYNDRQDIINRDLSIPELFNATLFASDPEPVHDWENKGKHVFEVDNVLSTYELCNGTKIDVDGKWNVISAAIMVADFMLDVMTQAIDYALDFVWKLFKSTITILGWVIGYGWLWGEKSSVTDSLKNTWTKNWNTYINDMYNKLKDLIKNIASNKYLKVVIEYFNGTQTFFEAALNGAALAVGDVAGAVGYADSAFVKSTQECLSSMAQGAKNSAGEKTVEIMMDINTPGNLKATKDAFFKEGKEKGESEDELKESWEKFIHASNDNANKFSVSKGIGTALDVAWSNIFDNIFETIRGSKIVKYTINDNIKVSQLQMLSGYIHNMNYCPGDDYHDAHCECRDLYKPITRETNWFATGEVHSGLLTYEQDNNFIATVGSAAGACAIDLYFVVEPARLKEISKLKEQIAKSANKRYLEWASLKQSCPHTLDQINSIKSFYKDLNGKRHK